MRLLPIFLITLVFASCSLNSSRFIDTFDILKNPVIEIATDSLLIDKSTSLIKMGEYLIISKLKGDYVFALYSLEKELLKQFIRRGRGPGEISQGYFVEKLNDSIFSTFNPERSQISRFLLKNGSIQWISSMKFEHAVGSLIHVSDKLLVTSGHANFDVLYGLVNQNTDSFISEVDYPSIVNPDLNPKQKMLVYRTMLYQKPNSDTILSIYEKHIMFDILYSKGNKLDLLTRMEFMHFEWSSMGNGRPMPKDLHTPYRVFSKKNFVTEDGIFIYFEYTNPDVGEEYWLLRFDWNGHKIGKYRLPYRIDELAFDNEVIYGIALIEEYYELIKIYLD